MHDVLSCLISSSSVKVCCITLSLKHKWCRRVEIRSDAICITASATLLNQQAGVSSNNYILSPGAAGATSADLSDTVWFLSPLIPTGRRERLPDCSRTRCVMCPQLIDWVILCNPYLTSRQRFVRTLEESCAPPHAQRRTSDDITAWERSLPLWQFSVSRLFGSTPVWMVFGGATCATRKFDFSIFSWTYFHTAETSFIQSNARLTRPPPACFLSLAKPIEGR